MEQSEKRRNIIRAAKLYYYGNMSQEEIAKLMGTSRPKVSRMLSAARQLNIVQIAINDPLSSGQETGDRLRVHFGLQEVVVLPSGNSPEAAKQNIGRAAAAFLNDSLTDTLKVGIAWGTTLNSFVQHFHAARHTPQATVVQLVGGVYQQSMNMDARELVKNLAGKLRCGYSILQAPLLVQNPDLQTLLLQEPEVRRHMEMIQNLDLAFVGLGSVDYRENVTFKAEYIRESEAKELVRMGLAPCICGHHMDMNGHEPESFLSGRIVGATLEDIAAIPNVVGLGAGNEKVDSILAGIRGGYLKSLIIDEVAAIALLEREKL